MNMKREVVIAVAVYGSAMLLAAAVFVLPIIWPWAAWAIERAVAATGLALIAVSSLVSLLTLRKLDD